MISIKLQQSTNATVSAYRELYEAGKFVNREGMLNALAEDLLNQLTLKEEIEALVVSCGKKIVKLRVPVKYLSETAKEEDKEAFKFYKTIASDIAEKGYGAIVFPAVRDENGNPLFDLEVL